MRKLVTIQIISAISPIPGADNIETAHVLGWECVIRKADEFKSGDKICYIETDSFLPVQEPFLFLKSVQGAFKKNKNNQEGFKIRVQHMGPKKNAENEALGYAKQISNGLVMKLDEFEQVIPDIHDLPVDTDLTERVGAIVFEKFVSGEVEDIAFGGMPSAVNMTEQERIQNNIKWFSKYHDLTFEVTEKVDGMSASFVLMNGEFMVCNRTLSMKNTPGCKHWDYAIAHGIEQAMREFRGGANIALQGEMAGEGIEKNHLQLKGLHFFLFDIWDIDNRHNWVPQERADAFEWFHERCGIEHVPVIEQAASIDPDGRITEAQSRLTQLELEHDSNPINNDDPGFEAWQKEYEAKRDEINTVIHPPVHEFINAANGESKVTPGRKREGLVFKSNEVVNGSTVSFKVLSDLYKLKNEG